MLNLQIKQAQCAMADGRLDEAYDLARRQDVRRHRRGQLLIGRIVEQLVERGQAHLDAGRLDEALSDCDRAARLGGNQCQTGTLRAAAVTAITARQREGRQRHRRLDLARQQIEQGRLTMGEQLVCQEPHPGATDAALLDDIAVRRAGREDVLLQVQDALGRDDCCEVIRLIRRCETAAFMDQTFAGLRVQMMSQVNRRVREDLNQGRIDRAAMILDHLAPGAGDDLNLKELHHAIEACRLASSCIESGDIRKAWHVLKRLALMLPDAHWVQQAADQAQQAVAAHDAVRAGPIGLVDPDAVLDCGVTTTADARATHHEPHRDRSVKSSDLPDRFLIQIDGVGSYLVVRKATVRVGSVSSSRLPDVALLAQASIPTATFQRLDDDYFLRCDGAVRVNDRSVSEKLLASGDKIVLGPRCSMKYRLPNAASTSAVLELSGAKLPRADTRKVVLLDRTLIIGPGSTAHIRADKLKQPSVLQVRDGRLCHGAEAVTMSKPLCIGSLSMILTEW